jgi:hypothetical protein
MLFLKNWHRRVSVIHYKTKPLAYSTLWNGIKSMLKSNFSYLYKAELSQIRVQTRSSAPSE